MALKLVERACEAFSGVYAMKPNDLVLPYYSVMRTSDVWNCFSLVTQDNLVLWG